jgi:hypothetical protein
VGDFAVGSEEHPGIGHVDRTVGADCRTIQEPGSTPGGNVGNEGSGAFVEGPGDIDVGYPERVAVDRQALRGVQRDTLLSTFDELDGVRCSIGAKPADVPVVVLAKWRAVDVRDEPDIQIPIVPRRFGPLEIGRLPHLPEHDGLLVVDVRGIGQCAVSRGPIHGFTAAARPCDQARGDAQGR